MELNKTPKETVITKRFHEETSATVDCTYNFVACRIRILNFKISNLVDYMCTMNL